MGRANRLSVDGGIFHVTHRCHDRKFLLKFARDRNEYRERLRVNLAGLSLFDYTITSNHVHLLLETDSRAALSRCMRQTAGELARSYNRRKSRTNAFWGDTFHATLVEDGSYLFECLLYIQLNMVRCGVVDHPRDWQWGGYHELMGQRHRYRLLDLDRLCWRLAGNLAEVRQQLEFGINDRIARDELKRLEYWSQSLAVGSRGFLERTQKMIFGRSETEILECSGDICVLREEPTSYNAKSPSKNVSKAILRP